VDGRPATYATAHEAAWRAAVTSAAAAVMTDRALPGPQTRFAVEINYRLATPRTMSEQWDLDNLVKPTIDALTPILGLRPIAGPPQVDDERVDEIHATKRPVREGERPGAEVIVRALTAGVGTVPATKA